MIDILRDSGDRHLNVKGDKHFEGQGDRHLNETGDGHIERQGGQTYYSDILEIQHLKQKLMLNKGSSTHFALNDLLSSI